MEFTGRTPARNRRRYRDGPGSGEDPDLLFLDFSAEYYLSKNCRHIAGVSNLTDERYCSRVFSSRLEPAPTLNGYAGISIGF